MQSVRSLSCAVCCAFSLSCSSALAQIDPSFFGFTNVTEEAGIDASYEYAQPVTNVLSDIPKFYGGGAVGDFNRDGFPDLFVLSGTANPDRLYINNGDGTFTDRASEWGIAKRHHGVSAAAGDYNGDGHLDLYVPSYGTTAGEFEPRNHMLYRNNGNGTFTEVGEDANVNSTGFVLSTTGAVFGDYDLDGDLDIFVTTWDLLNFDNEGHRLFENNGDGTFRNAIADALDVPFFRVAGFTPAFADMNGDRYPELLIAGDFETSQYCVNAGDGTFAPQNRVACGVDADYNAMGMCIADLTGDGWLDWYISNISRTYPHAPDGITGQTLYVNQAGTDTFVDTARESGVEIGYWGWGADTADFNNDGLLDLCQTNGWNNGLDGVWEARPSLLWLNDGDGTFTETGLDSGFDSRDQGRGIVTLDYDVDGDMDIVVFNNQGPVQMFRNDLQNANEYLKVRLDTSNRDDLAPDGFGARIDLTVNGVSQMRNVDANPTFLSTSEIIEHFGLGDASVVDRIDVTWPDGEVTSVTGLTTNQTVVLSPSDLCRGDCDRDGDVDFSDLVRMLSSMGGGPAACDSDGDGAIVFSDLMAALAVFGPC